jgi:hypothetical protein
MRIAVGCLLGVVLAGGAWAQSSPSTTTEQMCAAIRRDVAEYLATGHPCPCPYNPMRDGRACGNRSAWAKPGGRAPRCYFEDVTGEFPPNPRGAKVRDSWPPPPPC